MKHKHLEVDFIGGGRPLTKEDEIAISTFIQAQKAKRTRKSSVIKRAVKSSRRKAKV
jgi:hypothetical protein